MCSDKDEGFYRSFVHIWFPCAQCWADSAHEFTDNECTKRTLDSGHVHIDTWLQNNHTSKLSTPYHKTKNGMRAWKNNLWWLIKKGKGSINTHIQLLCLTSPTIDCHTWHEKVTESTSPSPEPKPVLAAVARDVRFGFISGRNQIQGGQ